MKAKKNQIIIYEKTGFRGNNIILNSGTFFADQMGIKNNSISSIKLGPRTVAKFYKETGGTGDFLKLSNDSLTETKNYASLPYKWHDVINSIRIYKYGQEKTDIDTHDLSCDHMDKLFLPYYTGILVKIVMLVIFIILSIWSIYKCFS